MAEDRRVAMHHADVERRRAVEDEKRKAAEDHSLFDLKQLRETKTWAKQKSLSLGGRSSHAQVVLGIKHKKDDQILDWITCELSAQGPGEEAELVLIVCCPVCVANGTHPEEAQLTIRQSNRMFHLDQRTRSERRPNPVLGFCAGDVWVNPATPSEVYTIAGMITTNDWIRCPNLGCHWHFKIGDSIIYSK